MKPDPQQQIGNTVRFSLNAAGRLVSTPIPFLRGESKTGLFTVSLAPIWPAGFIAPTTGNPILIMQWGSGGGRQQVALPYPQAGLVFTVAADYVELTVQAMDTGTAVNAQQIPTVVGWLTPSADASVPVATGLEIAGPGPTRVELAPFTRSITVCSSDAAWTNTLVQFQQVDGATVVAVARVTARVEEIPVPQLASPAAGAKFVTLTSNAGAMLLIQNQAFG